MTQMLTKLEAPHLTTAIRQFAGITQDYEASPSQQKPTVATDSWLDWQELEVLLRKRCKDRNMVHSIKLFLRQLLQKASEIIGEDESIEAKESAAANLFLHLYDVEKVSSKEVKLIKSTIGPISLVALRSIHESLMQMIEVVGSEIVVDISELLKKHQNSSQFGHKIKFSSQLPRFVASTSPDSDDDNDDTGNDDFVNHFIQLTSDQMNPQSSTRKDKPRSNNTSSALAWLKQQISMRFDSEQLLEPMFHLLKSSQSNEQLQNELCELLGFEQFDLVAEILQKRNHVVQELKNPPSKNSASNRPKKANYSASSNPSFACQVTIQTEAEKKMAKVMRKEGHKKSGNKSNFPTDFNPEMFRQKRNLALIKAAASSQSSHQKRHRRVEESFPNVFDLKATAMLTASFVGGVKMSLPEGCAVSTDKRFEEIRIPATQAFAGEPWPFVKISQLDELARIAFKGMKQLNTIQSRVFETAYSTNENLLICAPTGAGKTNVAMLTIVREIGRNVESGVIQLDKFKIVYVAPMKALAAEMTANFSKRLASLGVSVRELTGDMQLTKKEIANTQMLVTTPEKWDVVTRKSTGDVALARMVRLLIIDEVHLLHDERGPVLETLVARTLRQVETQQTMIRIVGLSATLPNYLDVAKFLRVSPYKGLFFFDGRFRPVPLQQTFIGVKARSLMQQRLDMDEACYNVVTKNLFHDYQVLVFVHARNATVRTANALLELARSNNETSFFSCQGMEGFQAANKQMQRSRNREVRDLFQHGISVHHAGMLRSDRTMVEQLFSKGLIRVLCCTATLAWGVNLPAHAVVIKGTQLYNAKVGNFIDLGILDVLQIFGRAGRPQFDTTGEGTIITTYDKLSKYLSLMTRQNPIESQFVDCVVDNLNAEICLGTVNTVEDGVKWLSYTYLYTRMRKNPHVYGIAIADLERDPLLEKWQHDLIVAAGRKLDHAHMVRFEERTGYFFPTDLGRTSSHFYIKYRSIETFNELLNSDMDITQILAMISKSHEFEQIKVRDDELDELDTLVEENCLLVVKGGAENPEGKANILLQTYISNGMVNSFSLSSDLMYIAQNAARIVRGVFEIVLKKGMTRVSSRLLKLCKCVDRRLWPHNSPLRQFGARLGNDVLRKLESAKLTVERMRDMPAREIGNMLNHPRIGEKVLRCVEEMPNVHLETSIQPITRTILRIKLVITPDFRWNNHAHGSSSEPFWVWVEDPDTDHMYHSEYIQLTKKQVVRKEPQTLVFTIPLIEPHPTQYMVHLESDRWFGSNAICPVSFKHLILPQRHPPHTVLLDLEPLPITALEDRFQSVYKFSHFNPIQTQIFHCLYHTDTNALIGAPTGSGKTVAAELSIFRMLRTQPGCKAVYVAPLKALVRERMNDWSKRLSPNLGLKLVELTGDIAPDMRAVAGADVIITTPEKWDGVSRSWQSRGYVRQVALLIIDEIHLLGQDRGPVLEVIVSRTNFISSQTERPVRIVGLSTALANARDLADWLGIKQMGLFNFRPSVRPVPMEVHINGFAGKHYCPRMATMNKPCFQAIQTHSPTKPALIFVSSRRQTRLTALDLIAYLAAENDPKQWLHMDETEMEELIYSVKDSNLRLVLAFGIGIHHAGLVERDRALVERLFAEQKIQTLIATSTLAWGVNLPAHLVIVKGTEYFDGKQSRYVDFPITDVLQMMGRAGRPQYDDKAVAVILVHDAKKAFYKKFLYEPFPVESSLLEVLQDHVNAEIVAGTIANKQEAMDYLTWTYFFRRLLMNPTYYDLQDTDHESINLFLSKLLEQSFHDLRVSGCVADDTEDGQLEATNAGRISSFYYLSHLTMRMLHDEMKPDCSIEEILLLLSNAQEYHELPVRHNEDAVNSDLARDLPVQVDATTFDSPHTKSLLLLYAHLCRTPMPSTDYITDLKSVLDQAIRVLQAFVDASADCGWIVTSLRCMHCIQMVSQASWFDDSTFMTLPHVERNILHVFSNLRWRDRLISSLPELIQLNHKNPGLVRRTLEKEFNQTEVNKISAHLSALPVVNVELCIRGWWADGPERAEDRKVPFAYEKSIRDPNTWISVHADQEYNLAVQLKRLSRNSKASDDKAATPRFPKPKLEGWFLVLGNRETRELLALKRVSTLRKYSTETLSFLSPKLPGKVQHTLWLVSDSYIGLDQLYDVRLDVIESDIASQVNQEVSLSSEANTSR